MRKTDDAIAVIWEQVDDPNEESVRRVFRLLLKEPDQSGDNRVDGFDQNRYSIKKTHH